jgi:lipopolysaccharide/colanic/teichoic acid biosynthesis glycosyltransferase
MFGQARTELDRRNDFDAPQIVSKCDDARIGLRHNTSIKVVENSAVRQLSPVDFTPHSARIQPWKGMLDVCCLLIAIPCLLPLILSIAALIKLSTKGPILFKQRIGFNVLGATRTWAPTPSLPTDYSRYLLWQKERLHAWPGPTALWQDSGKNRLTFSEMIECDIRSVRTPPCGWS